MIYRALFSLRPLCRNALNSCSTFVRHASLVTGEQKSLNFSKVSFLNSQRQLLPVIHLEQMQKKKIEELPIVKMTIECPKDTLLNEIYNIIRKQNIEEPEPATKINEIQAARLIVIRRRKMKKHKLKKLRKKMKFEWAKVRQRREMRKEKAFQAELLAQIKQAEKFSAAQYVNEKLQQANENPIPRFWKGKRLPQFIIKEKLGIK